jgi:hypothetical protein
MDPRFRLNRTLVVLKVGKRYPSLGIGSRLNRTLVVLKVDLVGVPLLVLELASIRPLWCRVFCTERRAP